MRLYENSQKIAQGMLADVEAIDAARADTEAGETGTTFRRGDKIRVAHPARDEDANYRDMIGFVDEVTPHGFLRCIFECYIHGSSVAGALVMPESCDPTEALLTPTSSAASLHDLVKRGAR